MKLIKENLNENPSIGEIDRIKDWVEENRIKNDFSTREFGFAIIKYQISLILCSGRSSYMYEVMVQRPETLNKQKLNEFDFRYMKISKKVALNLIEHYGLIKFVKDDGIIWE